MKKITRLFTLLMLLSLFLVQAQVVNPVSATTDTTPDFGTDPSTTIDGTGLESFPSLTANHAGTSPANSYVTGDTSGSFDFEFDATYTIDGFSFWNQNAGGPGAMGSTGLNEVIISSSTDGTTFTPIEGAPTSFAQVTTTDSPPETFSFDAINATVIRIAFTSNHGDALSGFGEIAFEGVELGLSEQELSNAISIFPNPSTSQVTILNNSNIELDSIGIYDITGKLLINKATNKTNTSISIDQLASGMYILKIKGDNRAISKRLIKS